jgi:hypothetical protein
VAVEVVVAVAAVATAEGSVAAVATAEGSVAAVATTAGAAEAGAGIPFPQARP